ncbi:MAG TPA: preprotein translocase subunit SecG [Rhodanobacteraceae bacterium]
MFIIFSVFYILVAAAMTVLILLQRGEGANAGASFGGGSSGTMFGASGSATFMSRATAVLFALFIIMSLGMAMYLSHTGAPKPSADLGVMSGVGTTTSQATPAKQAAPAVTQPATAVPAVQGSNKAAGKAVQPAGTATDASAVPTVTQPAKKAAAGDSSNGKTHGTSGSSKN